MPNFLSTSDLNAVDLKKNFIEFLKNQDRFKDYNYEGSNLSALLDVFIQNTSYGNHYLNMVGSEGFIDSAELRESIVSKAKELNYTPRSRTSARSLVTVSIIANDNPDSITIPKGYIFSSNMGNERLNFITNQNYIVTQTNNIYSVSGVEIFEGEYITEAFDVIVANEDGFVTYLNKFVLQSENVDITSIEVSVMSGTTETKFTRKNSLFGLTPSDKIYFINGYKSNQYEIEFGDDIFGSALSTGDTVIVKYRDTVGFEGNGINVFAKSNSIQGYSNITVSSGLTSYGGSERESNESIKFNAVRHFQTQERTIIADDYVNIIKENFPEIEAISVYGGEVDKLYGKVIISLKPYSASGLILSSLKNRIINFLKLKNMTTEPIIVDAEYFYIEIDSNVRYEKNYLSTNTDALKTDIINNLLSLNNTFFNSFGKNVYSSQISNKIGSVSSAILSNSTNIRIIKKWNPVVNTNLNYVLKFDNVLQNPGSRFITPLNYESVIETSVFTYTLNDIDYTCWIKDNGNGILQIITFDTILKNNIVLGNCGTVNYENGTINILIQIKGYLNSIKIYAKTESRDILINKNKFIILNSEDFKINMIDINAEQN